MADTSGSGTDGVTLIPILKTDGENYFVWEVLMRTFLTMKGLDSAICPPVLSTIPNIPNTPLNAARLNDVQIAEAMFYLLARLSRELIEQTMHLTSPPEIWQAVATRFQGLREVALVTATHDWQYLRVDDFESIDGYAGELYRITVQLAYCGKPVSQEDMIRKTILTLSDERALLRHMYWSRGFSRVEDVIQELKMLEVENAISNEICAARPPGTMPNPDQNFALASLHGNLRGPDRGRSSRKRIKSDNK